MKLNHIIIIIFVIAVVAILFYTFQGEESSIGYIDQIEQKREEKDNFMRTSSESPFAGNKDFKGLNYFPIDARYRVVASLLPIREKAVVVLSTSDGKEQHYLSYAYAEFALNGIQNKLRILEVMEEGVQRGTLFLPFGDATSAMETYGAGRYLDIRKVPGSSTITLDFNLAYNPYCAYSNGFSCPLPPPENLLSIAIKAGEKTY